MQGAHSQSTLRLSLPCLHLSGEHIRFVARQLRCGCQSTVQLRIHIESDEVLSLQSLQQPMLHLMRWLVSTIHNYKNRSLNHTCHIGLSVRFTIPQDVDRAQLRDAVEPVSRSRSKDTKSSDSIAHHRARFQALRVLAICWLQVPPLANKGEEWAVLPRRQRDVRIQEHGVEMKAENQGRQPSLSNVGSRALGKLVKG